MGGAKSAGHRKSPLLLTIDGIQAATSCSHHTIFTMTGYTLKPGVPPFSFCHFFLGGGVSQQQKRNTVSICIPAVWTPVLHHHTGRKLEFRRPTRSEKKALGASCRARVTASFARRHGLAPTLGLRAAQTASPGAPRRGPAPAGGRRSPCAHRFARRPQAQAGRAPPV